MTTLRYHQLQLLGSWNKGVWRPIVGLAVLAILFLVLMPLVVQIVFLVALVVSGSDVDSAIDRLVDLDNITPLNLAYLDVALAMAIPSAMLVAFAFHGLRPGWLASVTGRLRWRWMLTCLGLSVLALMATLVVAAFLPAQGEGTDMGGSVNDWTTTTRNFVLVVVFLTPLQAAGEEYAFRGYLTQAFGGLFGRTWAAVLLPATLFALAHGAQDLPIFFDRFAFGVVAGILVIATGGLEAGIAMHVLNNFLAFGLALAFSDMSSALNPTGGSWWNLPVTLTQSLVYLALAIWAARRLGVRTSVEAGGAATELEGLGPRV